MKRFLVSLSIISIGFSCLFIVSCKKETPDTETQSSLDNAICEGEFNKSLPIINSIAITEQGVKSNRTSGPSVSLSDTTLGFPITMTIDYGTIGIEDSIDHKVRKGQIVVRFNDHWHSSGAKAIVKLLDYYVANSTNGEFYRYSVDSMILTHNLTSFSNTVINGKCSGPSYTLYWSSSRAMTQTEGYTTPLNTLDDVFSTSGNSTGKDRNGKNYTVKINSPIIKRMACPYMESGTLDITPEGSTVRTIDYGNGTCDSKATITINGNTFAFNMN